MSSIIEQINKPSIPGQDSIHSDVNGQVITTQETTTVTRKSQGMSISCFEKSSFLPFSGYTFLSGIYLEINIMYTNS